jgi:hypothetical protein
MAPNSPLRTIARQLHQLERLTEVIGQRLVADDIDAPLQTGLGNGMVAVIGRHDGHDFDTVRPVGFPVKHLLPSAVAAVVSDFQRRAKGTATRWIAGENAGGQAKSAIANGGLPVSIANV